MNDKGMLMVAGASGQLGQAVASHLAGRCGDRLILGSRSPDRLQDFRGRVNEVRRVDFDDPATMKVAFAGIERLLMISTDDLASGRRAAQHKAAIRAAVDAGVRHIVYTSITRPEPGALISIAPDHYETEQAIAESGLSWTILRNNCYLDFAFMGLLQALVHGALDSAARGGAISYVGRSDCALAAARALEAAGHDNGRYDITGPAALTAQDIAELAADITGKPFPVCEVTAETFEDNLTRAGMPPPLRDLIVSTERAAACGHLGIVTGDFEGLTGQAPVSAETFFKQHAPMLIGAASARQT